MKRQDKVQAYNVLALNQRRADYAIGSNRWQQCNSEMIEAMNALPAHLQSFVYANFHTSSDWVSKLSAL